MGIQITRKVLKNSVGNKKIQQSSSSMDVPKGHVVVYIGENCMTRQVIPISYLNHALFQRVLHLIEEEFGYEHPMGGLTIPCNEEFFANLIFLIRCSS